MTSEFKIVEEPKKPMAMHPKKFGMWLFVASVGMLFASLTSAYIVRQAEGNWLYFSLPPSLYWSTGVIIFSSVTMQMAYWAAKKDLLEKVKWLVAVTLALGLLFLGAQLEAWKGLVAQGVYFVGNPSGSFLYVITGLHGLHIISALVYLAIVLVSAYRLKIHSRSLSQMEMCTTYWHFLGGLWLYLFIFLLLNR
ncbi:MAG: cytochrome c oxidase subunit 3 [Cyclobacteriaceae bacterium]|nr:cytochrome c oxidase subunit 3 [Cyclobacteriaceae bacterium]MCB0498613.1 cytochrome c oxidase subunit 3 [Cyclobacteriaceae bacterium]MCB9236820.1 cytochrome c oxidase subunit 3 [Flammeovirgaceae bacterium]MCO5271578.1 cytochrome c oxidase subunit 3 [Cyclobacteriaceae bacterium]MCW5901473.1 cytochrome c oxidase subunit 3 [Cyclobacteriaceae bacterium]